MAIAQSAQEIRSPVERSMSISRGSGVVETSSAVAISSSVVLPRADRTATTRWPCSRARTMRGAARLMRSASATEVPPNFMTTVPDTASECRRSAAQPARRDAASSMTSWRLQNAKRTSVRPTSSSS